MFQFPCLKDGSNDSISLVGCVGYSTGVGISVERLGAEGCGPQISESDGSYSGHLNYVELEPHMCKRGIRQHFLVGLL